MIPKLLANSIVVLVSICWAGNFLAAVFVPDYHADTSMNFVFMTIVGGALALRSGPGGGPNMGLRFGKPPRPAQPPAIADEEEHH